MTSLFDSILSDESTRNHRWSLERACEAYCVARLHNELAPRDTRSCGNRMEFNFETAIHWTWDDKQVPRGEPTLHTIERKARSYALEFSRLLLRDREFDVKLEADDVTKRMTLLVTMKP